jgi:hypothetical protein
MTSRDVRLGGAKRQNITFLGLSDHSAQFHHTDRSTHDLSQHARMLDLAAANMICGSACVEPKVVWVTCEGSGDWFDKSDERRLMEVAWERVDKDTQSMDQYVEILGGAREGSTTNSNSQRAFQITTLLKEFRRYQNAMRVQSISSGGVESMTGIVMDMIESYREFRNMNDPKVTQANPGRDPFVEHDDRIRRLVRILRRLPITRNHFCRTAGCILRYSLCLQEGSACTTRRLNQIQSEMMRSKSAWSRFMESNYTQIVSDVQQVFDTEHSIYVYDWTYFALRALDDEQNEQPIQNAVAVPGSTVEDDRTRGSQSAYPLTGR